MGYERGEVREREGPPGKVKEARRWKKLGRVKSGVTGKRRGIVQGMETEPERATMVVSYGEQEPQGAETRTIEM